MNGTGTTKKKNLDILKRLFRIREIGALAPLVVIFVAAAISNPAFTSLPNLLNMLRASSYIFIAGVGMTFILCGRNLDLSVGSQIGLAGCVLGIVTVWWKLPIWTSIPIALAEAVQDQRLSAGDLLCLVAFGSGFTWGTALVRW